LIAYTLLAAAKIAMKQASTATPTADKAWAAVLNTELSANGTHVLLVWVCLVLREVLELKLPQVVSVRQPVKQQAVLLQQRGIRRHLRAACHEHDAAAPAGAQVAQHCMMRLSTREGTAEHCDSSTTVETRA
jgi:hypothetical protein